MGVRYLCDWLGVSRSGYYAWLRREACERSREDQKLMKRIQAIHAASGGRYGSPRVHEALLREDVAVGRKRVERLMQEAGLVGRVATLYRRIPGMARFFGRHQNLRLDLPPPTAIDQVWVGDLTYIRVGGQWRYLAVVMDLYSRRVIGWSLGERKTADLTLRALRPALRRRTPKPGLLFHTDRGAEYGADIIQRELARHGIRASMNRPGCCTDNGYMESFFHSLKAEAIHGVTFKTEAALRQELNHYIGQFYNHRRLHSGIGYKTPVEYEEMAA